MQELEEDEGKQPYLYDDQDLFAVIIRIVSSASSLKKTNKKFTDEQKNSIYSFMKGRSSLKVDGVEKTVSITDLKSYLKQ
jgi:hypothetical protein